jgi:hypothetical protein
MTAPKTLAAWSLLKRTRFSASNQTRGAPSLVTRCRSRRIGPTATALDQRAAAVHKEVPLHVCTSRQYDRAELRCLLQVAEVMVEALSQHAAEKKVVEIVQGKKVPQLPTDKYFDI